SSLPHSPPPFPYTTLFRSRSAAQRARHDGYRCHCWKWNDVSDAGNDGWLRHGNDESWGYGFVRHMAGARGRSVGIAYSIVDAKSEAAGGSSKSSLIRPLTDA